MGGGRVNLKPRSSTWYKNIVKRMHRIKKQEEMLQQRRGCAITLDTRDIDQVDKQRFTNETHETIVRCFQQAFEQSDTLHWKHKLEGISKLKNGNIRLNGLPTEAAKKLRWSMDWSSVCDGLKEYEGIYGMVIHGVPKTDIDFTKDQNELIDKLHSINKYSGGPWIEKIAPLRRKATDAPTHSIIVFSKDTVILNEAITIYGFNIKYRTYRSERYIPQMQLTQYFNCHGYNRRASQSKSKSPKYGKCAHAHETQSRTSIMEKCSQCRGKNTAWLGLPQMSKENCRKRTLQR